VIGAIVSSKSEYLQSLKPFIDAGFALHWLKPRSKAPVEDNWSDLPRASLEVLTARYREGQNLGLRLGEPSKLDGAGAYLHVIDLDIRFGDLASECHEALEGLFPGIDFSQFPSVISGSGGESRHIYFATDKPFRSKKLAKSEGKHRRKKGEKEGWSNDWEIELFGTGKQVAMPPSVHPDTCKKYTWERPFDPDALELGLIASIPSNLIASVQTQEHGSYDFEARAPLVFSPGQLEGVLDDLPNEKLDDYADWVTIGQALHHQFGGLDEGFDLWVKHSKRSEKFEPKGMLKKWRSFGKSRRMPVTMGTIVEWVSQARQAKLADEFDDLDDEVDAEIDDPIGEVDTEEEKKPAFKWSQLLELTEDSAVKGTLHNIKLIVENDRRLVSLIEYNEFTQDMVQRRAPGIQKKRAKKQAKDPQQLEPKIWNNFDEVNGSLWRDVMTSDIRKCLEAPATQGGYGLKIAQRDLEDALAIVAQQRKFHPVKDYLEKCKWDGKPRVERLFIDFLGSEDNSYTRSVAKMFCIAAVTRIFEPGHKFDFAVILEGLQGRRKSTFVKILARNWFSELQGDFHDPKQMIEHMQGSWILEIPELQGFNRSDVRAIKAFMSRMEDRARLAYAHHPTVFKRQCVFIGTSNDKEYLKDETGGRRFWPMECHVSEIDTDKLERQIDFIWAEALTMYRDMRSAQPFGTLPLYLASDVASEIASDMQEKRRIETAEDGLAGQIAAWLNKPIEDYDDMDEKADRRYRTVTCLTEIWSECLGGDRRHYDQLQAQRIGKAMKLIKDWESGGLQSFKNYGRQRAYLKKEDI
jgi:hypothetical protein